MSSKDWLNYYAYINLFNKDKDQDYVNNCTEFLAHFYKSKNIKNVNFDTVIDNFKKTYIDNENDLENVRNAEERKGLSVVYDFLKTDNWKMYNNICIILELHRLLYSQVEYKEAGGQFRNVNNYISGSDIKTSDYYNISTDIYVLNDTYLQLIKYAHAIVSENGQYNLFDYLESVLMLKTRIIEIHPFYDGNGRTARALVNMLLSLVNIPPIYIKASEKKEYIDCMDTAIRCKDVQKLYNFYIKKITDSVVELILTQDFGNKKDEVLKERNDEKRKIQ